MVWIVFSTVILHSLVLRAASVTTADTRIISQSAEATRGTGTIMRSESRSTSAPDDTENKENPEALEEEGTTEADDDSLGAEEDALLDDVAATDASAIAEALSQDENATADEDIPNRTQYQNTGNRVYVAQASATASTCCGGATAQQLGIEGQAANSAAIVAVAKETENDARRLARSEGKELKDLAAINSNGQRVNQTNITLTLNRKSPVPCYTLSGLKKLLGWGCGGELKALAKLDADDRRSMVALDKIKSDVAKLQHAEAQQLKNDELQAKIETQVNATKRQGIKTGIMGWSARTTVKQVAGIKQLAKEANKLANDASTLENKERRLLQDHSGCNNKSSALSGAKEANAVAAEAAAVRVKSDMDIVAGIVDQERAVKLATSSAR